MCRPIRFPVQGARLWPTAVFLTVSIAGLLLMAVTSPGWVRVLAAAGAAVLAALVVELFLPHFVEVTSSQVRVKVGAHTFRMAREEIASVRVEPGRLGSAGLVFVGVDGVEYRPERMQLRAAAGRRHLGAEQVVEEMGRVLVGGGVDAG